MKSVLLHIRDDRGQDARLAVALDIVRAFDAHLTCVQATPFDAYVVSDTFGGVHAFPEIVARVREREQALKSRTEVRLSAEGLSWTWISAEGDAGQMLVDQSRLTDLVVVSQPTRAGAIEEPLPIAGELAVHARAPVAVVPVGATGLDCTGRAVIGWNGSPEAGTALRQSMAMLQRASAVELLVVGEERDPYPAEDARTYLLRHGIDATIRRTERGNRSVASAIAEAADGAAWLAMGAYGRSRLRELILGGVTDGLIHCSRLPLLLSH